MKSNDRQKICSQCDGRIPIEAVECPYCGVEIVEDSQPAQSSLFSNQSIQTSLTSLYAPPYGTKPQAPATPSTSYTDAFKKAPETFKEVASKAPAMPSATLNTTALEEEKTESKVPFGPILILSCASNFLILGLLQCLFSENGRLSMEWDSSYWFIYCLLSLPMFFYGYKKIAQLK